MGSGTLQDTALSLSPAHSSPTGPEAGRPVGSQGAGYRPPPTAPSVTRATTRLTTRLTFSRAGPPTAALTLEITVLC